MALTGLVVVAVGCVSNRPPPVSPDRRGMIVGVRGDAPLPAGIVPAFVWEVDGERVLYDARRHPVDPGLHRIRVWPDAPESQFRLVPDPVEVDWDRIDLETLEILVQPGHTYRIGAQRDRFEVRSILPDGRVETSGWHHTITPVLLSEQPPATLEEAAKGLGWILLVLGGSSLIVPLFF
jgi:hypothetical protein